jgi:pimeloyl-ACP methyl ester carboxylesterase
MVARALGLRGRFEDWIHGAAAEPDGQLAGQLAEASQQEWWPHLFLRSRLPDERGRDAWIAEMDFDPRPVFARVAVPTLLFYGGRDSWTPVDASVAAWQTARGGEVEVVVLPDAEHDLTLTDGTISTVYEQTLVNWLTGIASNE